MITVRVARMPGTSTSVRVPRNATVADALAAAHTRQGPNESLIANGKPAQLTDHVTANTLILILQPDHPTRPASTARGLVPPPAVTPEATPEN